MISWAILNSNILKIMSHFQARSSWIAQHFTMNFHRTVLILMLRKLNHEYYSLHNGLLLPSYPFFLLLVLLSFSFIFWSFLILDYLTWIYPFWEYLLLKVVLVWNVLMHCHFASSSADLEELECWASLVESQRHCPCLVEYRQIKHLFWSFSWAH